MAYQPKSYRKFLATSLSAALVATSVPVAGVSAASNFKDVDPEKHAWAIDAIDYLVEKGAIEGKPGNIFDVHGNLTRAEAATILARAFDLNISDNEKTDFVDARDHWASKYIAAIQRQLPGVINGYNGRFNPNDYITRQELAKMIVEAYDLELVEDIDVDFPDNTGWGKEYVKILASNGIVEGLPSGNFGINQNVTRAQAAVFFYRTEVEEARLIKELAVTDVKVLDANTVQVSFNDGNSQTYTVDTLEPGFETEIEIEYKNKTFKIVVTYDPNQVAAPGTVKFDNQPSAKSLPAGSPLNEVYRFQITAGEDPITLRSVQLKQYGTALSNNTDIENVHLAVNGDIRATGSLNANNEVRLTRSITIPANSTVEFTVLADIATTATPTATVQFGIESINAFTANAKINGTFPNVGNAFNIVAGNIGNVTVTGSTSTYNVETGDVQEELGRFTLRASDREGVKIKRIVLSANGLNADDFDNLYLYQNNGSDKIEVQGVADRNEVVFDLSKANIEIGRNQAKTFVLKGDPIENGSGSFEFSESYHVVAEGLNSGYNNGNSITSPVSLGTVNVAIGAPKFRVSTNSPKQGDKIVASTSEYGVVREYTLNPAGQDITLRSANIQIDWLNATVSGNPATDLSQAVRTVELYDATSGAVIGSYDIPSGSTSSPITYTITGLNWAVDKPIQLQVRAVATADEVNVQNFDVLVTNLNYDILTATGSKNNANVSGPVTTAQPKEFTTSGGVVISRPDAAVIDGYSISGGLSNAPFGGFRVEAKDEALKITDAKVKISGAVDTSGNPIALSSLIANPVLLYDGEIVAYGDINDTTGEVEFSFDKDFIVETGTSNRKILKMQADVLEAGVNPTADITVNLTELKTRGVKSNVVSTTTPNASLLSDGTKLDYRNTTVAIDVSKEPIDTIASSNTNILKFTVTNLAPNDAADKQATIYSFGFKNLFAFPNPTNPLGKFVLRDDKVKLISDFEGVPTKGGYDLILKSPNNNSFTLDGNDDKEFFLYGDLSEKDGGDYSVYRNVRMRLDIDVANWNIEDANNNQITPLLINDEGPDITIRD